MADDIDHCHTQPKLRQPTVDIVMDEKWKILGSHYTKHGRVNLPEILFGFEQN